jgi:histidine phosphotransferase ChpT
MADLQQILSLVELTCARLCHDLGGLIGTVGNAIDMAAEDPGNDSEVLAFAASASKALRERLRLLRAAWGPEAGALTVAEASVLAEAPLSVRRITLDASALAGDTGFSPAAGRVFLNLILLAADSLPRGGTIRVAGAVTDLTVRIDGPGARWPSGLIGCLGDEQAAFAAMSGPGALQTPLTVLLALGRRMDLTPITGPAGIEGLRLTGPGK